MKSRKGTNQRKDGFTVYKSYSFIDKDPVIDRIRTMIADQRVSIPTVSAESGVSDSALRHWLFGTTKRPQFASTVAVIRALGYDVMIVERSRATHADSIRVAPKLRVAA